MNKSREKKDTRIICGFPGVGKSYIFDSKDIDCIDSDSSNFDKEFFPENYIKHIIENIGFVDYIFVSTHKEVVDALSSIPTNFTIVYPDVYLKEEYLKRYKERGNNDFFINLIDKNWNSYIKDIEDVTCDYEINKIKLNSGEFLKDVI